MSFSVTILGSSAALPTSNRYPTAQILNVSERFFLIDCGEGTQMQLRKYHIKPNKINHIFISHLHGDHLFGLIGLISTLGLLGRKNDLMVYANGDLEPLLKPHLAYFCADLPYKITFQALNPKQREVIYCDEKIKIESFPLKHRIASCGFIFTEQSKQPNIKKELIDKYDLTIAEIVKIKEGGDLRLSDNSIIPHSDLIIPPPPPRSYAFCSDTRYFEKLATEVKDVDLLYHESTFLDKDKDLAKKTGHSTAAQAAKTALNANAKKLIIGHFSARYKNTDDYLNEAKTIFNNTLLANEGQIFEL